MSVQETRGILKIGFALSKWRHFNSAYVLGVFTNISTTVLGKDTKEDLVFSKLLIQMNNLSTKGMSKFYENSWLTLYYESDTKML